MDAHQEPRASDTAHLACDLEASPTDVTDYQTVSRAQYAVSVTTRPWAQSPSTIVNVESFDLLRQARAT